MVAISQVAGKVHVIAGPVFDGISPAIGNIRVRVPQHLFKLIYDPASKHAWRIGWVQK